MPKKQPATVSKRQLRKEEIRKKEARQRFIFIGGITVLALILLAAIVIPSISQENKSSVDYHVKITPQSYPSADGTTLGNPNARVKIDVFSDFQCSACAHYALDIESSVIHEIVEPNDVYYVFHQYPFMDDGDPVKGSDRAALASECAAEQNRFWDYKNILYANQTNIEGQFSDDRLILFAKSLGLNKEQFEECLSSDKYQDRLDEGMKLGAELGVNGTPTIFINGQNVSPGKIPSFDQISALTRQALQ